ncbi:MULTISPECIES: hypothetical protein [unclassified Psychrobacter]|uniref:hypothetical protein n=1 Tax=unclassified Psychrobacter TaxID=196806 RepID=UPI0025B4A126|nr:MULTISPECIES: hypothetical protein [unclassified Psychrobacter]MDN3453658.1 hypothetical protein [Psychrobacter sp. APC 3350]MDN3501587.1 hypothetical protein [Psychrobacter sp. 5A.1]
MKKITPIIIGVFFLFVMGLLVFYFKPANSQDIVPNAQQENHSNTDSNASATDSLKNSVEDGSNTKANTGGNNREMGVSEDASAQHGEKVDFNKKVYGYVTDPVDGVQTNGQTPSTGSANKLYNTQSDLTIKPVDPAKDPGNQVASFD